MSSPFRHLFTHKTIENAPHPKGEHGLDRIGDIDALGGTILKVYDALPDNESKTSFIRHAWQAYIVALTAHGGSVVIHSDSLPQKPKDLRRVVRAMFPAPCEESQEEGGRP